MKSLVDHDTQFSHGSFVVSGKVAEKKGCVPLLFRRRLALEMANKLRDPITCSDSRAKVIRENFTPGMTDKAL